MKNIETTLKYEDILLVKPGDRVYIPCSININFPSYVNINNEGHTLATVVSLDKTTIYHNSCIYEILNNEVTVSVEANGCYSTVALHIKDIYRVVTVNTLKEYSERKEYIENILNKELNCRNEYIKNIPNIDEHCLYNNILKCNILFNKEQLNDYSVGDKITIINFEGTVFDSYIKNIVFVGITPMLEIFVTNKYIDKLGIPTIGETKDGILQLSLNSNYIKENLTYFVYSKVHNKIFNFKKFEYVLKFIKEKLKNNFDKNIQIALSRFKFYKYNISYNFENKDGNRIKEIFVDIEYLNKKDSSIFIRKQLFSIKFNEYKLDYETEDITYVDGFGKTTDNHVDTLDKLLNKK